MTLYLISFNFTSGFTSAALGGLTGQPPTICREVFPIYPAISIIDVWLPAKATTTIKLELVGSLIRPVCGRGPEFAEQMAERDG